MSARFEIPYLPRHLPPLPHSRPETLFVHVPPRWEYHEVVHPHDALPTQSDLNALGDDGWELVGIAPAGGELHYYFKRERPG